MTMYRRLFFLTRLNNCRMILQIYVLKPLFSFAGQGVVIDLRPGDIEQIRDPQNWILQKKVQYADALKTPDGGAKVEIRMMYMWKEGAARPVLALT